MLIGIDFDNTIVCYDDVFYEEALKRGWISDNVERDKSSVRDYVKENHGNDVWTELQGFVYTDGVKDAKEFPDVKNFINKCKENNVPVVIVSHKTEFPVIGPKKSMHEAAGNWLSENGFDIDVFFEVTREDKINRIRKMGCTHYIDDLPEVFEKFPKSIARILFDPEWKSHSDVQSISSWKEIQELIFDFQPLVEKSLGKMAAVEQLRGGGNNRVYRVLSDEIILLKFYFRSENDPRDRLDAEFSFVEFAWNNGVRCIPKPLARDDENGFGFYEFIEGEKVEDPREDHINEVLDFLVKLNKHKEKAESLGNASEACFTLQDHFNSAEWRLEKLRNLKVETELDSEALDFVNKELIPAWKSVKKNAEDSLEGFKAGECISPSDYGFHNALERDGKIVFLDFEYGGWDDPAKMVCDFFCHPGKPVSLEYYEEFVSRIIKEFGLNENYKKRIDLLMPVHRIKWCGIILNEFLNHESSPRKFALKGIDHEKKKKEQLEKARIWLKEVKL